MDKQKMEAYTENIVAFLDKSRKILLTGIAVVLMMIFIRGCLNQIFDYKEDVEYLKVRFF